MASTTSPSSADAQDSVAQIEELRAQLDQVAQEVLRKAAAPPAWLLPKEAAARARVSIRVLYREAKVGRLRAARVGGRRQLRFREAWIDQWLESTAPQEIRPSHWKGVS